MSKISAQDVSELRRKTGAGMMDCKRALEESGGDMEGATTLLRTKGLADAAKRAGRDANEGIVDSYIHQGGRVGVLLEVNCETDFVARNEEFQAFVHDVALHIAASRPEYVAVDDVPDEFVDREKAIFIEQMTDVPDQAREKAVEGKLKKALSEITLLEQPFVKDLDAKKPRTIEELRAALSGKLGENVTIRRFVRFELGG
ncbi:MAG: translation elongation factor Ts [Thermoleophilia bacterium]|nr:translation elongation factor Ts [Thermoleophilia bacterium]MDH3724134.1 translation elongation factor Ts [Thermoleophilia bacterium]